MSGLFPIIHVPDDAPLSLEDMGSKEKFWFLEPGGEKCLFKAARPGTGEDWAEKVAAELAGFLGLPHAHYDLAIWRDRPGVVAPRFVPRSGALVHGNELLGLIDKTYPRGALGTRIFSRTPQHSLDRVFGVLGRPMILPPIGWSHGEEFQSAPEVFVGYLLLDAWIGNTDRHHENWGLVFLGPSEPRSARLHLAPTFDHASSLGRELSDSERAKRLDSRDPRFTVRGYATSERARSALYLREDDPRPMKPLDAFLEAAKGYPVAGKWWVGTLLSMQEEDVRGIFARVPSLRMSNLARQFSLQMLRANQQRIREAAEANL